jgi:hypothetical protein
MGQYYKVVILSKTGEFIRAWLCPFTYNNGSKLMEHSYINNELMNEIEYLLSPEGIFYKSPIIWAGDYANDNGPVNSNLYHQIEEEEINKYKQWMKKNKYENLPYKYIVNHTKKLYVDKYNDDIIHPLPILVNPSNGMGGGDYKGNNKILAGSWSYDIISMEEIIPEDYDELKCEFKE